MTYKKTWLSYLLWAAYTCLTGVMLANYAILFWQKKINATINYGTVLFVFFTFGTAVGSYILLRYIFGKIREKYPMNSHTRLLWEIFIALSIFFAGLLLRVSVYLQNVNMLVETSYYPLATVNTLVETSYYQLATVKAETTVEPMVHGASYLYTMCLSFVFSFLGNKITAAVWLQILVQMTTIFLAYIAVRRLAGRIPACIAMFVLAVSSTYVEQILVITPESLFFALYLAGMFIIGGYVKHTCQNRTGRMHAFWGAVLSGFIIGFLTYLDAIAVTLFFFLFGLLTGKCREKNRGFFVFLTGTALTAGGLAFAGMLALHAYSCYTEIGTMAESWFTLYRDHLSVAYHFYRTEYSVVECFLLVIPAFWLIMAFWNRRKTQNVTPWFFLLFLLAPTPLAASGVLPYQVWSVFLWGVLAGIGVQQTLVWEKSVSVWKQTEASDSDHMPEEKAVTDSVPAPEEGEAAEPEPVAGKELEVPAVTEELPEKPRFLENPLPLPKKHEKRTMDFQYEVREEMLKFDVETEEDDDFDIL